MKRKKATLKQKQEKFPPWGRLMRLYRTKREDVEYINKELGKTREDV